MRAILLLSICVTMVFTATWNVTFQTPDGILPPITCPDDQYILDCGLVNGINLPYSPCRCGYDSTSTAILSKGTVDQSDQIYLSDAQIANGFVLLEVAYATSDCIIITNQEGALY